MQPPATMSLPDSVLAPLFVTTVATILFLAGCVGSPQAAYFCDNDDDCPRYYECIDGVCLVDNDAFDLDETGCADNEVPCGDECVDLTTDNNDHCGDCFNACGDGYFCEGGECHYYGDPPTECVDGERFCDGECVDVSTDDDHCGGCFNACGADEFCDGGTCSGEPVPCAGDELLCDGQCINPMSDPDHCGGCHNGCGTDETCDMGICEPVPPGCENDELFCNQQCLDPLTDDDHCGGCDIACGADEVCDAGSCTPICADDELLCSDQCIDPMVDDDHCGACNNACGTDETCDAGSCIPDCADDELICSNQCIAPMTDDDHCGGCNNACLGDAQCIDGACLDDGEFCDPDAAPFGGGDGSADNPYLLCDPAHLSAIDDDPANLNQNYELFDHIDMTGVTFQSIGENPTLWGSSDLFSGTFDGAGFEIQNLTIDSPGDNFVGLFTAIDNNAALYDVVLTDVSIEGQDRVGALAGQNEGTISGGWATGDVDGRQEIGGLVGRNIGLIEQSTADVTASGTFRRVGGLVGDNRDEIIESFATGDLNAPGANGVGGLVGRVHQNGVVEDCYATGDVDGDRYVGGFVGGVVESPFGSNPNSGEVYRSWSDGAVTGTEDVGGFSGINQGDIVDSYWNTDTSNQADSDGGTGVADADFDDQNSFDGFDFTDIWQMDDALGDDRPLLQWWVD